MLISGTKVQGCHLVEHIAYHNVHYEDTPSSPQNYIHIDLTLYKSVELFL